MDSLGIIFELQWKRKHGVGNRGTDIASLGIWDTADSSLDWKTFKSYLSQNLGTTEDITVAYVDSEGDELPIESECEFREALKFARQRARKGHNIVLKVDKDEVAIPPVTAITEKKRWRHTKQSKSTESKRSLSDKPFKKVLVTEWEDLQTYNTMLVDKLANMSKLEEQQQILKTELEDSPPVWFKKYMQKMKAEIVSEVNNHTRQMLASLAISPPPQAAGRHPRAAGASKSKKRTSDEESSDTGLGNDQRDHKLFRKIERLHKFQKKWDSKLEKLETKTKRIMEKKCQTRERVPDKKTVRKHSSTYLMDAIVLNDGPKAETHITLGKRFTKIWEIMNNGTLPWTDKTELRLAWGTLGLEPEESVVKCPILEPGEKGQIAVNFRAPDFSGTFESYWHFYHMGERFGHWIGCAVVVSDVKIDNVDTEKPSRVADQNVNIPVEREVATTSANNNNINAGGNPQQAAEYESESDDDNLSVISAFSSDSDDEDDKFVMVPMPACFLPDVPLAPSVNQEDVNEPLPTAPPSNAKPPVYAVAPGGSCVLLEDAWPVSSLLELPAEKAGCADVHILPETFVNGAINVASSAYSKAQALIGHLRAKQSGDRSGTLSSTQCLMMLSDMGFHNRNLNIILLQRFDNDIGEVVAELLRNNQR